MAAGFGMRSWLSMVIGIGACLLAANVSAADLRASAEAFDNGASRLEVVVDELFLLRRRCQRDPDCIAPRVLPIIPDGRRSTYVSVAIPIDPRFVDRYQR